MFGHEHFQPVIEAIIKLAEEAAKEPWDFKPPDAQNIGAGQADRRSRAARGLLHQGEAEALRRSSTRPRPR